MEPVYIVWESHNIKLGFASTQSTQLSSIEQGEENVPWAGLFQITKDGFEYFLSWTN